MTVLCSVNIYIFSYTIKVILSLTDLIPLCIQRRNPKNLCGYSCENSLKIKEIYFCALSIMTVHNIITCVQYRAG